MQFKFSAISLHSLKAINELTDCVFKRQGAFLLSKLTLENILSESARAKVMTIFFKTNFANISNLKQPLMSSIVMMYWKNSAALQSELNIWRNLCHCIVLH